MKRDRNTFFSNYSASSQSYIPQPQMPNMQMPAVQNNGQFGPYQAASTESNFYAGPNIQANSDFENRLAKIERQINRLDARITRLENGSKVEIDETNNYSNMYML